MPLADHLPPEEAARFAPRRRLRSVANADDGLELTPEDDAPRRLRPRRARPAPPPPASTQPYADWQPGMFVQHDRYGVGQLVSLQPAGDKTRARVRFVAYGEKTFILEQAPIRKLERPPR